MCLLNSASTLFFSTTFHKIVVDKTALQSTFFPLLNFVVNKTKKVEVNIAIFIC